MKVIENLQSKVRKLVSEIDYLKERMQKLKKEKDKVLKSLIYENSDQLQLPYKEEEEEAEEEDFRSPPDETIEIVPASPKKAKRVRKSKDR